MALAVAHSQALGLSDGVSERFAALYAAHAADVWRWARRMGGPRAEVEDLVQEVFFLAHRGLSGFRGESTTKTWLFRITVRVVGRHRPRPQPHVPEPAPVADPEGLVAARQAEAELYRALDTLAPIDRALLIGFELNELSGAEVAEALDIKPENVWVRLHRARRALQKAIEAHRDD